MDLFYPAILLLIGAAFGIGVLLLGILVGFFLRQTRASGRVRRRRRLRLNPVVVPPLPVAQSVPPAVALPPRNEQPAPEPLLQEPPAVNEAIGKVIEAHARAVRLWQRGEHAEAYSALMEGMAGCAQLRNPWLSIEIAEQMRSLACVVRQFAEATQLAHFVEQMRSTLPAGTPPGAVYLKGDKIDDMSWMTKTHMSEMQAAEPAFQLHQMSMAAATAANLDDALELAKQALSRSVSIHGMNHWISAFMLHGIAQVHLMLNDPQSAHPLLVKAHMIMGDWPYALPQIQGVIANNLDVCQKALGEGGTASDSDSAQ